MKISAPANFDLKIIKRLAPIVYETYGNLNINPFESIVPSYALPTVSLKKLKQYVKFSHSRGIKFNYILSHSGITPTRNISNLLDELEKIAINTLTISNHELIAFVKQHYPFQISTSILCGIDSLEKALEYKNLGCDIICLDYKMNHNLQFIKEVKSKTQAKIKLLANNLCLPDCPYKEEHFKYENRFDSGSLKCLKYKLNNLSFFQETGFIYPETITQYEEAGCDILKIGGRTKPSWWIIDCVSAYSQTKYQGNHFKLTNFLGAENKCHPLSKAFLVIFPDSFIKKAFKLLYLCSRKKIFKILSQEKNIKPLIRIFSLKEIFYIDKKEVSVDNHTKKYLLKQINSFLGEV